MPPGQPIQTPSLARITGSIAVTRPPGERPPRRRPVGLLDPVDRQPVGDDHEVVAHASTLGTCRAAHSTPSGSVRALVSGWPDTDCRAGRIVAAPVRDDAGAMTYLMTQTDD